jgi:hypothetical protein
MEEQEKEEVCGRSFTSFRMTIKKSFQDDYKEGFPR